MAPCGSVFSEKWPGKRKPGEKPLENLGPAVFTHPRACFFFYKIHLVKEVMMTPVDPGDSPSRASAG